jgi:hypothetical protein
MLTHPGRAETVIDSLAGTTLSQTDLVTRPHAVHAIAGPANGVAMGHQQDTAG